MKSTRRDYVAAVYQVSVNNIIAQHGSATKSFA